MELRTLLAKLALLVLVGGVISFSWASAGFPRSGAAPPEELPLNITAGRLEVEQDQQVISFIEKVVARYKDIILYADALKIFYEAKPAAPGAKEGDKAPGSPLGAVGIEKITRIEAQGKVRVVQNDRVATGDKAVYYTQDEKIVLLGNPQLWRGNNSLKGQEIVFYLKDNRAVVDGGSQRVEAVIYPSARVQFPGRPSAPSP